jgi:cellulose synthase/poly-beta-1,6-N-acetylglucosamine synthase-like glycosyltransferase
MLALIIASSLLGTVAIVLLLPTVSDGLSVFYRRPPPPQGVGSTGKLLVLVPAHDEEAVLVECLEALTLAAQGRDSVEVVVLADNSTDRTAEIARRSGVRCLERHDPTAPGKPAALAWALEQLASLDYDAFAVVDADTIAIPAFAPLSLPRAPGGDARDSPSNGSGP